MRFASTIRGAAIAVAGLIGTLLAPATMAVAPLTAPEPEAPAVAPHQDPLFIVIAHRGASGVLPEHTLPAVAYAHAQGAHYLEQDVVLSADGVPVVLHDLYLDSVTDVAQVFEERAREDGRHYVIDFSLDELRQLRVTERLDPVTREVVHPRRFPPRTSRLGIATLAETIELVLGMNQATGRDAGLYIELKGSAFHASEGKDISAAVMKVLRHYGLDGPDAAVWLQSFEPEPLIALREAGVQLRLVQLIGDNAWRMNAVDFDTMRSPEGLAEVADYADAIGPWYFHLLQGSAHDPQPSALMADAREAGLAVHTWTLRADQHLPEGVSFEDLLTAFQCVIGVDGVFTDHPDRAMALAPCD